MVRCGAKNGCQKDIFLKGIGAHAQNMMTILSSVVNIIGVNVYDHLMNTKIFTSLMDK